MGMEDNVTQLSAGGDSKKEEENESSSDDTEEEEVEPKLQYERLKNYVRDILKTDAASCVSIHSKFFALGTHLGVIYILDHQGNKIEDRELFLHVTTVNQISIEEKGDYFASCSNDGKVVLHGMYSTDSNTTVTIERPVRSIALDPYFGKSSSNRRFIVGEDKVVLYEKGLFARYKSTVLYQGEGAIRNIQWKGQFLVWSSDKNVRMFDLTANVTITVIKREMDANLRAEMYRCNFYWKDNFNLLIGWGNSVKICKIVQPDPQRMDVVLKDQIGASKSGPPRFYVEITSMFNTDFCISGISAMDNDVVVLTVMKDTETMGNVGLRPQLRVLEPHGEKYASISRDILTLHGYQSYKCNDYHLGSLYEEGLYFILSPKDFVVARPRDEDDHIKWLLDHEKFKEALDAVLESKSLKCHTLLGVGQRYLDHLLSNKRYKEAAELCPTILGTDKDLWEFEVYRFVQIRQLRLVAPYIPIQDPLKPEIYELVLNEYLQTDPKGFLDLIHKWPCKLYSIPAIVTVVKDRISTLKEPCLQLNESLCALYTFDMKYDEALNLYIEIGNTDRVFELIEKHDLFVSVQDKLEKLMELNPAVATGMFLNNMEKLPIDLVVAKLESKPKLLFDYLPKVFNLDPTLGVEHHGLMVELYAEYASSLLLSFLRNSNNYALEHAFKVCQQRNLTNEMIYLLGRMGNTKQALQQIMHDLQDINQAIEFCKEHNDKELWEDLIECSLDKSGFITVLLQNIGTHVDPKLLIQRIPEKMEIPGLRDSLVKIIHDYNLQISLREGCEKILVSDCYSLLEKLHKQHRRGILISEDQVCKACDRKLLVNDIRNASDIYVFNCRHAFHEACVSLSRLETCSICSAQKRSPGFMK